MSQPADAERGGSGVGLALRARLAKAFEDGLVTVEQVASLLHVPGYEAERWNSDHEFHTSTAASYVSCD